MHELTCPSCNQPSQYDFRDYLLMCPFCSATFRLDVESGQKEIFPDHFIVSNTMDARGVKDLTMEWFRRLHHKPGTVEREYFVTNIQGLSVPFWIVSLEAHTNWKGLVQKRRKSQLDHLPGSDYLVESGHFRRNYRWGISARSNLCETWGMTRLHEPKEDIFIDWDGFPLDSTFSRGRMQEAAGAKEKSAYDSREFFEFKYANGLPILSIQVEEEEALRRAKDHVSRYHQKLAKLNVDFLLDHRTELEIAGIQLVHLPFWYIEYVYHPKTALRHFYHTKPKHVIVDGHGHGILKGEIALGYRDKIWVNSLLTAGAALVFFLLGAAWHPAFFIVALFALLIAGASVYIATIKAKERDAAANEKEKPEAQFQGGVTSLKAS